MSQHRDIKDIRDALSERRDIYLFPATDGPLLGVHLRRGSESYVKGADTYHPFQYKGWLYYGQAFAIDRVSGAKKKPTDEQEEFREAFERCGGIHAYAKNVNDAIDLLGEEPENVAEYINRTPMRMF